MLGTCQVVVQKTSAVPAPVLHSCWSGTLARMFGLWPQLVDGRSAPLLAAAATVKPSDLPAIARLRRDWPAPLVAAALELTIARRKAAEKFEHPEQIVADVAGVEQATSLDVARHKARRFAETGAGLVLDLCCGIGGDSTALAQVAAVLMVDRDPVKAWMARRNVGSPAAVADVTRLRLRGRPFHLDPSRRSGGRRKWRYEEYEPGPAFIKEIARGDGAVKLSPGVEFEKLPPGEVEVIQRRGTLVQAVLWTGRLAHHPRTATRIDDNQILHGVPDQPIPIEPSQRYLYTVDPVVERAGLMGELCRRMNLPAIHPALALLSSNRLLSDPWLTPFELLESMPWRPRKVKQWLTAHNAGVVEVKTRGGAVDPDEAQRVLRGQGKVPFTVFVLRFGAKIQALITRRKKGDIILLGFAG